MNIPRTFSPRINLPLTAIEQNVKEGPPTESESVLTSEIDDLMDSAAVIFQKNIRLFNATQIPEPSGEVPALRNEPSRFYPDGKPIAYAIRPETDSQTCWVKLPPRVSRILFSGTFKELSHENIHYVGLTIKDLAHFESLNARLEIDVETLAFMREVDTEILVPQFRINETKWLAKNLGLNLALLMEKKLYKLKIEHWVPLAKIIASMHAKKIVHRDIKPLNLYFLDGFVRLSDLDSMGTIGKFQSDAGTVSHSPAPFWRNTKTMMDNNDVSEGRNAVKKDQYNFIASMIEAHCGIDPIKNQGGEDAVNKSVEFFEYRPYGDKEVGAFCKALPCCFSLQKEIVLFLNDPVKYQLSQPLDHYLVAGK